MAERYGKELAESLPEAAGGAGLRRLPRHRRPARRGAGRRDDRRAHPARPPRAAAADPGRPPQRRQVVVPGHAAVVDEHTPAHLRTVLRHRLDTRPGRLAQAGQRLRPAVRVLRDPGVPRRVRLAYAARSCWPRPSGWPGPASASWCWSARTPPRTARTWATRGRWRSCCRSSPRSTASSGCGSATCSRPRPGPAWSRRSRRRPAWRAYFDLSFQHSSEPVLRRMRRFGSTERFLELLALGPRAGARAPARGATSSSASPARPAADVDELVRFLTEARLDAIGVFDYSDEDGTEAAGMSGKVARGHDQAAVRPADRARRRAVRPAGRGPARLAPSRCWSTRSTTAWSRAGPRTRRPRSTARPRWSPATTAGRPGRAAPRRPRPGPGHRAPRASTWSRCPSR